MPTYEYACRSCGEHLEVVQGFKDAPLTECGRCGGELRKVFSAAGIIFKGSGYYVTDSRKSAAGAGSSSSDSSSSESSESSDTASASSESTTDTKKSESGSTDAAKSA